MTATAFAGEPASDTGISVSGQLDIYGVYNFNKPGGSGTGANTLRFYDTDAGQFSLALAELTFRKKGKELSALIDLDFGQNSEVNGASDLSTKNIGQAYATYVPASDSRLTFDLGKMATHLGAETMKASENWQYSRSAIFSYALPLWHLGAHAGYELFPSKLTVGLYAYNGWNITRDNNAAKDVGTQIKYTPNSSTTLTYNFIGGAERPGDNGHFRTLNEANLSYMVSEKVAVAIETAVGHESQVPNADGSGTADATWGGAWIATKFQLAPKLWLSPRFEYYRDDQGTTLGGTPQNLTGLTITVGVPVTSGVETKFEFREDHSSNNQQFNSSRGPTNTQTTGTLGILLSF